MVVGDEDGGGVGYLREHLAGFVTRASAPIAQDRWGNLRSSFLKGGAPAVDPAPALLPFGGPSHVEDGLVPRGKQVLGGQPGPCHLVDGHHGHVGLGVALYRHDRRAGRQIGQGVVGRGERSDDGEALNRLAGEALHGLTH